MQKGNSTLLTLEKGNEIQKCCIQWYFTHFVGLKWLNWDTVFWLKAIFKCMATHIENFTWIPI